MVFTVRFEISNQFQNHHQHKHQPVLQFFSLVNAADVAFTISDKVLKVSLGVKIVLKNFFLMVLILALVVFGLEFSRFFGLEKLRKSLLVAVIYIDKIFKVIFFNLLAVTKKTTDKHRNQSSR